MILFCIPFVIWNYIDYKKIIENGEYANAVIYELGRCGGKSRYNCILYRYTVDGIQYEDSGRWYPKSDTLSVGDSIMIMYEKDNPANSKTKRDLESKKDSFIEYKLWQSIFTGFKDSPDKANIVA